MGNRDSGDQRPGENGTFLNVCGSNLSQPGRVGGARGNSGEPSYRKMNEWGSLFVRLTTFLRESDDKSYKSYMTYRTYKTYDSSLNERAAQKTAQTGFDNY